MKKENFEYLYSFKYKEKDYIYLTNKNYPFYFLGYNHQTKTFDYPDFNTFKELYRKFSFSNKPLSYDVKNELKKIKEKLKEIHIELPPLVRTTSGLLALAIALSMCGCSQINNENETTIESSSIVSTSDKNKDIYNYFKQYDMEVVNREYDGNDYIFVNKFINNQGKTQITIENFEDFRSLNNLDFVPTWDDVITTFETNPNIDEEKKQIIISGIEALRTKEELKEMDLSVLYLNAKKMNIKYLSTDEMINTIGRDSVYAYFDTISKTVYLPNDNPLEKFEFIHEVLGHGSLAYREETDDSTFIFDCTNYLMLPTDNRYTGHSFGIMVSEGGANLIAHLATNDYSVSNFYELYEEELRVISELCNVSIGELFNHKGISLYDLMYQNHINTPVEYIYKMDGIYKGQLYCEFSDLMERLFADATEEKIVSSDALTQEQIIKNTISIIRDSYFKEQDELTYSYSGGTINYNFEETVEQYSENMNSIRNSK